MRSRRRSGVLALLLATGMSGAGCVSSNETVGGLPTVHQGDVPNSRRDLRNPTALDLSYARWQEDMGHLPEAAESYRRVLKSDSDSVDARLGLARIDQLAGRSDAAEKAFLQLAEENPKNAKVHDALGQFYAAEKRWGESIASLAKAVELMPTEKVFRHHYAVALARSGNATLALEQFKQALGEAEAHYNVGYILYEQGNRELAEREFLQAVTLKPSLTAAQTMLDEIRRGRSASDLIAQAPTRPGSQSAGPAPARTASVMQMGGIAQQQQGVATAAATVSAPEPAKRPTSAAPTPTATASKNTAAPSNAASTQDWEMPTRRDPASIFAEQLQNQAPLPAQR